MAWSDLLDLVQQENASSSAALWKELKTANQDFSSIQVCRDLEKARTLLELSNMQGDKNELIAVSGLRLQQVKGTTGLASDLKVKWIGYDYVGLSAWSILKPMFGVQDWFDEWGGELNEDGLFATPSFLREVKTQYDYLAKQGRVEEFVSGPLAVEAVKIGRVERPD